MIPPYEGSFDRCSLKTTLRTTMMGLSRYHLQLANNWMRSLEMDFRSKSFRGSIRCIFRKRNKEYS